jgi:hypothetical protein
MLGAVAGRIPVPAAQDSGGAARRGVESAAAAHNPTSLAHLTRWDKATGMATSAAAQPSERMWPLQQRVSTVTARRTVQTGLKS